MLLFLIAYGASVVGFKAGMLLLVLDEQNPSTRRAKRRALILNALVWPAFTPVAAIQLRCHRRNASNQNGVQT